MNIETIPEGIREDIREEVERFNEDELDGSGKQYQVRFEGRYVYIDRDDGFAGPSPILRLGFTGNLFDWEFAIFKYSMNDYDEEETFFPGADQVDGTLQGALRAGMKAYG